jgi:hypothetical protein
MDLDQLNPAFQDLGGYDYDPDEYRSWYDDHDYDEEDYED